MRACLKLSPKGDCSNGPHGLIAEWDVSRVTSMSRMFMDTISFNGDISKWDVPSVTDMNGMFFQAISFNAEISGWDVVNSFSVANYDRRTAEYFVGRHRGLCFHGNMCLHAFVASASIATLHAMPPRRPLLQRRSHHIFRAIKNAESPCIYVYVVT